MAIMPSFGSDKQPKKEPLSSSLCFWVPLSLPACRHCTLFHIFFQLLYTRDGVVQNEADSANFARKLFLRKSRALLFALPEVVCDKDIRLRRIRDELVVFDRENSPVLSEMPRYASQQMFVGRRCERHFGACRSPSLSDRYIQSAPHKGTVRWDKRDVAILYLCCYQFTFCGSSVESLASSSPLVPCAGTLVFFVGEPLLSGLQNVSPSPGCCRLVVISCAKEEGRWRKTRTAIIVHVKAYSDQERGDSGETTLPAATVCALIEFLQTVATCLLCVGHPSTRKALTFLSYYLATLGSNRRFSVRPLDWLLFSSLRSSPFAPTAVRTLLFLLRCIFLHRWSVHAKWNPKEVQLASASVVSSPGRAALARCVSSLSLVGYSSSSAAVGTLSGYCLQDARRRADVAFILSECSGRVLIHQSRDKAFFCENQGYAVSAAALLSSFFFVGIYQPSGAASSALFPLQWLPKAIYVWLSSAVLPHFACILYLLYKGRMPCPDALRNSSPAVRFPLSCLMHFLCYRNRRVLEPKRQRASFFFVFLLRNRQAREKGKLNAKRGVAFFSLLHIIAAGCTRRVRVLRCMSTGSLTLETPLQCLRCAQPLSSVLPLCILGVMPCLSAQLFLAALLYYMHNSCGDGFSSHRQGQPRQSLTALPRQQRHMGRGRSPEKISPQQGRSGGICDPFNGTLSLWYVFAGKLLFSPVLGKLSQAATGGDMLKGHVANGRPDVILCEVDHSTMAREKHVEKGASGEEHGEEGERVIRCLTLSTRFQQKKGTFFSRRRFHLRVTAVGAPFIVSYSTDRCHTRCASVSHLLVLWEKSTHSLRCFLFYIAACVAFVLESVLPDGLQLWDTSLISPISWLAAAPPAAVFLLFYVLSVSGTHATRIDFFGLIASSTVSTFRLRSLPVRGVSLIPRFGTCELDLLRIHTTFTSLLPYTLHTTLSFSKHFASSRAYTMPRCFRGTVGAPRLFVMDLSFGLLVLLSFRISTASWFFLCRLFCVVFWSVLAHSDGWRTFVTFFFTSIFEPRSLAPYPYCCRLSVYRVQSVSAAFDFPKILFVAKPLFLPSAASLSLAIMRSGSHVQSFPAASDFLKVKFVTRPVFRPAAASTSLGMLCSDSKQPPKTRATGPPAVTVVRMPEALAASADATYAKGSCSFPCSKECRVAVLRTDDAVFAAEVNKGARAVVASHKEVAADGSSHRTASFSSLLFFEVSTAGPDFRRLHSMFAIFSSVQRERDSLTTLLAPPSRKRQCLPFAWICSAFIYLTLLLYAISNESMMYFVVGHRRHWPAYCGFARANVTFPSLPWAGFAPGTRVRCWSSFPSQLAAVRLVLLLLLSWIASSAEFSVISDIDQNVFLDLTGGLSQPRDSLLIRMSAGRRFSILNFDKQAYELKPPGFRSEAFQILFSNAADKKNLTNPLECDVSLPLVRYSAYFFFASPLADFWDVLPDPNPPPPATGTSTVQAAGHDVYQFSWPRGYQAVSLGTGLCIQVVEKHLPSKRTLNVMFLSSSAVSVSKKVSSFAVFSTMLWTAVSIAVALLPVF